VNRRGIPLGIRLPDVSIAVVVFEMSVDDEVVGQRVGDSVAGLVVLVCEAVICEWREGKDADRSKEGLNLKVNLAACEGEAGIRRGFGAAVFVVLDAAK